MKAIILAGGSGTRMGALTRIMPKPMLPVAGKPLLEYQIELLRAHGVTEVVLSTGHLGQVIAAHFGNGRDWGLRITCSHEPTPLGTAGAVRALAAGWAEDFLVLYGDTLLNLDLTALRQHHRRCGGAGTLVVHPNDHPHDSDLVEADHCGRIVAFHRKPRTPGAYHRNLVNAALYVLSPTVLAHVPMDGPRDFGRDVFPNLVPNGPGLFAYNTPEYIKDVGTPQRLAEVEADVRRGRFARHSRACPRPAVFLDRDGVLNADRPDHVRCAEQLELLPGAAAAVRALNRSDYLAVVVTNQPTVAKGFTSEAELARIHARLETLLGAEGAYLDRIYVCPHHPEKGFPGERPEYKIACTCRKPGTALVEQAVAELNLDRQRSWFIGDRTVDLQTGRNAGLATVLVQTGCAGRDRRYPAAPTRVAPDLAAAVELLVGADGA